jgi:hypothetical protein
MKYGLLAAAPAPVNHLRNAMRPLPDDCDECVFLLRAFDRIGAAKYGDQWTGKERSTSIPELLPDAIDPRLLKGVLPEVEDIHKLPAQWLEPPSRNVLDRADRLLFKRQPDRRTRWRLGGLALLSVPITFTYAEWQEAQAEALEERSEAISAFLRWEDVAKTIKDACLRGILRTRLRKFEGGDYGDVLPAGAWRSEDLYIQMRFRLWWMHPQEYFRADAPDYEYRWIFATRDSLERLERELMRKRGCLLEPSGTPYESEYMQCMRQTVLALNITTDHMPKKEIVVSAIPNHWYGKDPLSPRDIDSMASFIRSEASRGGRKPKA